MSTAAPSSPAPAAPTVAPAAKITVDGKSIDIKDRSMILQSCLDAGVEIPHYCYHQGLSIPASCRICLVEVDGIPKLVPACNTPTRNGMVVHTKSPKAVANQKQVMEYLLVNHPLDCPVCDQAGECHLQDYSYKYGRSQSRFEEDKAKKPKKDVGNNIYLYSDRCIMCTRCVRFTREISGTSELYVDGRGHREEIDVFPGYGLNNKLAGNVVDLCPVGALLDKDFLFKQRVWFLKNVPSISPVDAGGENIFIAHNEGVVYRIKPRFNADVNQWWISDDTRYSHHVLADARRLTKPMRKQYGSQIEVPFARALEAGVAGLKQIVAEKGPGSVYVLLSPMMACEEVWLAARAVRGIDPQAVLVLGPVPAATENETFKNALTGKQTFVIQAEKVPNRRGVERVIGLMGGPTMSLAELTGGGAAASKLTGGGAWIVGGYLSSWSTNLRLPGSFKVVQDILQSDMSDGADVVLPAAAWAEKDGCWENHAGRVQAFASAVNPPEGAQREGLVYLRVLGQGGQYDAEKVRGEMGGVFGDVSLPPEKVEAPAFEFAAL